ncbi:TVP38/TMEM64 family protein [Thalassomonas sp. M1454]|uniref:TVP38/TMEM64 family protein n=1 Tax=Thalassomonas sp. M1454 TaxID=2594477 RepID=UPI00117CA756|nr:VTT domain-containing protein [Thalassomonas sp. M1454]TRX58005.1 TVP38/TMEM64 family protein [Thalassomonas sp. M1454]
MFKTLKNYWPQLSFILIFLIISGLIASIFHFSGVFEHFNKEWIETTVHGSGIKGISYFIAIIALATSCGMPRQAAAFAAGFAFGTVQGTLIATFAAAIGCSITFYTARFIIRPLVLQRFTDKVVIFNRFLQKDTFEKTFIIRLIPAGNNFLLNLCSGVGAIDAKKFIFASYLGFFPQMAIFAMAGSGIQLMSYWQIGASAVLSVIASLMSYRLYRKYKQQLAH